LTPRHRTRRVEDEIAAQVKQHVVGGKQPTARAACLRDDEAVEWVSLGLEAQGVTGVLRDALEHAAGFVFAVAPPPEAGFSLDNSLSYAQWIRRLP
jgi:hypothetical protein